MLGTIRGVTCKMVRVILGTSKDVSFRNIRVFVRVLLGTSRGITCRSVVLGYFVRVMLGLVRVLCCDRD